MLIFGGIFEVTRELSDMIAFDFHSNTWKTLYEESGNSKTPAGQPLGISSESGANNNNAGSKGNSGANSIRRFEVTKKNSAVKDLLLRPQTQNGGGVTQSMPISPARSQYNKTAMTDMKGSNSKMINLRSMNGDFLSADGSPHR